MTTCKTCGYAKQRDNLFYCEFDSNLDKGQIRDITNTFQKSLSIKCNRYTKKCCETCATFDNRIDVCYQNGCNNLEDWR